MTAVLCPEHGRSFVVVACPHLENVIQQKNRLPEIITAKFDLGFFVSDKGEKVPLVQNLFYCPICAQEHHYPLVSSEFAEDTYEKICSDIKFIPICVDCWKAAKSG